MTTISLHTFPNPKEIFPRTNHHTTQLYRASTAPALPLAVGKGVTSFVTSGRTSQQTLGGRPGASNSRFGCGENKTIVPAGNRCLVIHMVIDEVITLSRVVWKSFVKHSRSYGADLNSAGNGPRVFHLPF